MKTYLVSLTRGDAVPIYPIGIRAENVSEAITKIIKKSFDYKPSSEKSVSCLINVCQVEGDELGAIKRGLNSPRI